MFRAVQNNTWDLAGTPDLHSRGAMSPTLSPGACNGSPTCPHRAVYRGVCEFHRKQRERERYERKGGRLYDRRWRAESKAFLAAHPFCADCGEAAAVVDHDTPHRGDAAIFWDQSRWVTRCKRDHDRKSATRDGGFGHARQATAQAPKEDDPTSWG
jgi:5-methylcytosine-specific restriction protein A